MKTYLIYDIETKQILAYITSSDNPNINEVFANFNNYNVLELENTIIPQPYNEYKVDFNEDDTFKGFQELENTNEI